MEQRRLKITLIYGLLVFLFVILFGWYAQIDKINIEKDVFQDNLTDVEKFDKFAGNNQNDYDAYYKKVTTYKVTRSKIPFVYNKEILDETPLKLYTRFK